ncbi:hypothetical protein HK103_005802 [Boothiomyces macroporosus]|uniref:Uncharacterized protein n=1 Tax=Boothiomyces macroporosus TaxID=261099 RepID=A0AAD5UEL3_9FUNG|nr:hypothetical protein HK103_005802 [Boothiomyces macroporosus]
MLEDGKESKPVVPAHLGDIMALTETNTILSGDYSPLERICLTANGNLQRILSSYFNSKVTVGIIKNEKLNQTNLVYDRVVNLNCQGRTLCVAESTITITDGKIIQLIESKTVGIGQLFRYLNILPEFVLLEAGREPDSFWRVYLLKSPGIVCKIKEIFPNDLFVSQPSQSLNIDQVNALSPYQAPI